MVKTAAFELTGACGPSVYFDGGAPTFTARRGYCEQWELAHYRLHLRCQPLAGPYSALILWSAHYHCGSVGTEGKGGTRCRDCEWPTVLGGSKGLTIFNKTICVVGGRFLPTAGNLAYRSGKPRRPPVVVHCGCRDGSACPVAASCVHWSPAHALDIGGPVGAPFLLGRPLWRGRRSSQWSH